MRLPTRIMVTMLFLAVISIRTSEAQETFAPLISDDCFVFVHLDLNRIEVDTLKELCGQVGEQIVTGLEFDERSRTATLREIKVELDKLDKMIRPPYETLTRDIGIREIAVIADLKLLDIYVAAVVAVPWKDKTDSDLYSFLDLIGMDPSANIVQVPGFLLFPVTRSADDFNGLVQLWFEALKPSEEARIYEPLKECGDAEFKVAALLPDQLRQMIQPSLTEMDVPREIAGVASFLLQKIDWLSTSLSLSDLVDQDRDMTTLLTLKTLTESDAIQLRALLEAAIDFGVMMMQVEMQREQKDVPLPPLFFEFMRGCFRTLLPEIDGDRLRFRAKGTGVSTVVPIAGMAAGALLPAVNAADEAGRRAVCINNVSQIALAILNYDSARGKLPPLYTVDKDGKPLHSWRVLLLPYLEYNHLYEQIRLDEPWDSEHNSRFHDFEIPIYRCRSNPNAKPGQDCCYSAIAGESFVPGSEPRGVSVDSISAKDGTSYTICLVEVKEPFCWMDPKADVTLKDLEAGINTPGGRVGSHHPGGCVVAFFDRSVRFLSETIDGSILRALGTHAGGEVIRLP